MGQQDVESLEHTLSELEQRIMARIGRWAVAIIGSCIVIAITASANWFGLIDRVSNLETWKAGHGPPIEDYYEDRQTTSERLAKIEARIEEIYRLLQQK